MSRPHIQGLLLKHKLIIKLLLEKLASRMKDKTVIAAATVIVTVLALDLLYTVFFR